MYYVYFVQSTVDKSYYVGSTDNVEKRVKEHNQGKTKSLKNKLPVKLVYVEEFSSRTEARKRENRFKKSWQTKLEIIKKIKVFGPIV